MIDGMVSVITSIYNSEKFISQTIESVQKQTYENWEMLITDDCSTDGGCDIVEQYAKSDCRIRLLKLSANGGPGVARNNSILNARGQYIAFLDSDDKWAPDKLEKQIGLMKKTGCGMVFSSYYTCDENDRIIGMVKCRKTVRYWRIVCDNAIGFLTMMFDRRLAGDHYLPEIRKRQDWGLNISILKQCRIAYGVQDPVASYRIRKGSISRDKLSLAKYNMAIYKDVLGYSKAGAFMMFVFVFLPFYFGKRLLNFIRTLNF